MTTSDADRRSLLQRLGAILVAALGAATGTPALLFLCDPLRRRTPEPGRVPLLPLSQVPDLDQGGQPLRVPVVAAVRDAWNRQDAARVGAVWLYRRSGQVTCLSVICPHAGCGVDYDERRAAFVCPCHGSTFAVDGGRREGPAPRDMDSLEVEVKDGQVLCQYRRFRLATGDKEPL